jgi:hypothetical protein
MRKQFKTLEQHADARAQFRQVAPFRRDRLALDQISPLWNSSRPLTHLINVDLPEPERGPEPSREERGGKTNQSILFPFREISTLCSQENFRLGFLRTEFGAGNSPMGRFGQYEGVLGVNRPRRLRI